MAGKNKRNQTHKEEDHLEDSEGSALGTQDVRRIVSEEQSRLAGDKIAGEERAEARRMAAEERADKRRREERLEDEKRRKAEKIEEEERAERRAEARLRREEERAEERAEAKRQRKLEEARVAAELEAAKEEAAKIAAEKMMEQQQAMADRQFKQQEQLMKLQADISARAANERRVEAELIKKRDRAVSSIVNYKDVDDIEEYLMTAERKLRAGEVPEGEWLTHIAAKLTGKMGTMCRCSRLSRGQGQAS